MRGTNPAWANLPRRKCDDCGKNNNPKQPLREGTRGFCTDNCRKSYHKHGGAYRKLKVEMLKLVTREFARMRGEILRELMRQELKDYCEEIRRQMAGLPSNPAANRANR